MKLQSKTLPVTKGLFVVFLGVVLSGVELVGQVVVGLVVGLVVVGLVVGLVVVGLVVGLVVVFTTGTINKKHVH